MSTVFSKKFILYLIQSKCVSFKKRLIKTSRKTLTGLRVSKAGRPDLYRRSSYGEIFKHVFDRLDASQTDNWCLDSLARLPYQPQSDGFNRRTRQTPSFAAQTGPAAAVINGHGGIGV